MLPELVKRTVYYPLLAFLVDMNDNASPNMGRIEEDYEALGAQENSTDAQATFSSILRSDEKRIAKK